MKPHHFNCSLGAEKLPQSTVKPVPPSKETCAEQSTKVTNCHRNDFPSRGSSCQDMPLQVARARNLQSQLAIASDANSQLQIATFLWAAANGGVTNGGLRGVWPPFLEIGRNRPFSALFLPFSGGCEEHLGNPRISEEKGLFPQISSDFLKPPSLKPTLFGTPTILCLRALRKSQRFQPVPGNSQSQSQTSHICGALRAYPALPYPFSEKEG